MRKMGTTEATKFPLQQRVIQPAYARAPGTLLLYASGNHVTTPVRAVKDEVTAIRTNRSYV